MSRDGQYASDRYVTPGVLVALILVGGLIVGCTLAAVTYLTARGQDPAPVVSLVSALVAAVGTLGNLLLHLVGRTTSTKIERNTGQLASGLGAVAAALPIPPAAAIPVPPSLIGDPPTSFAAAVPASYGLVAGGRHDARRTA